MRRGGVDAVTRPRGAVAPALARTAALVVISLLLVPGCRLGAPGPDERASQPVHPDWQELALPAPSGAPGRLMLRDVTACDGRWFVVGAIGGPDDATRPAAWTSADGVSWEPVRIVADSYYGRQHVLYSGACRDGRFAALGAKSGGAHANPRVSSWVRRADGALVEVLAGFELYGGPQAVNVARMVAGGTGFMIVGNRVSGAAVWLSVTAGSFEIIEGVPDLATDERGATWLFDATAVPGGWVAVGGVIAPGRIDRDPLAWRSTDGRRWQRVPVPGTDEYDEMQRVVRVDGVPLAVGLRGRAFGGWRAGAGGWEPVAGFGTAASSGVPAVRGLTVLDGQLVAVVNDGARHAVWSSADRGDSWRPVALPKAVPAGPVSSVAVFGAPGRLLVVLDDGAGGAVFGLSELVG
ncbi:hypothetical protein HCA58_03985 [Micromonospora sp. HNM0581]|uniref:hypothetical protein n=1 Tax=Micromonospora sp. HNM0581 TaxID=2716341 RepID=UPI00146DBF1D|nr:hypothetical protein [Micromonospora sp. HNM0581]NLU77567.1 hypothetical protein [Micromonospora sp. HNM0581]